MPQNVMTEGTKKPDDPFQSPTPGWGQSQLPAINPQTVHTVYNHPIRSALAGALPGAIIGGLGAIALGRGGAALPLAGAGAAIGGLGGYANNQYQLHQAMNQANIYNNKVAGNNAAFQGNVNNELAYEKSAQKAGLGGITGVPEIPDNAYATAKNMTDVQRISKQLDDQRELVRQRNEAYQARLTANTPMTSGNGPNLPPISYDGLPLTGGVDQQTVDYNTLMNDPRYAVDAKEIPTQLNTAVNVAKAPGEIAEKGAETKYYGSRAEHESAEAAATNAKIPFIPEEERTKIGVGRSEISKNNATAGNQRAQAALNSLRAKFTPALSQSEISKNNATAGAQNATAKTKLQAEADIRTLRKTGWIDAEGEKMLKLNRSTGGKMAGTVQIWNRIPAGVHPKEGPDGHFYYQQGGRWTPLDPAWGESINIGGNLKGGSQ